MDRDPKKLSIEDLRELEETFPFAKTILRRVELVERAALKEQLDRNPAPSEFLAWAEQNEMDLPEELADEIRQCGNKRQHNRQAVEDLIAGIAAPEAKGSSKEAQKTYDEWQQAIHRLALVNLDWTHTQLSEELAKTIHKSPKTVRSKTRAPKKTKLAQLAQASLTPTS